MGSASSLLLGSGATGPTAKTGGPAHASAWAGSLAGAVLFGMSIAVSCSPEGVEPVELASREGIEPEVLALIDSSVETVRRDTANAAAHRRLAWSFEANQFWDEAARTYAAVLALDPGDHLSRLHRSLVLGEIGHDDEAFAELEKAAAALRDVPAAQFRLGLALLEVDRLDEAQECFGAVLAMLPRAPHAPYGLGLVAQAKGDSELARGHLERALNAAPGEPRVMFALGRAYQALGHEDLARTYLSRGAGGAEMAVADPYSPKIEVLGRSSAVRLARAERLRGRGLLDQAISVLRQALVADPTDKTAMSSLSLLLIEAERFDEAQEVIQDHLDQYPDAPYAYYDRSILHGARGELSEAVRAAERAVEMAPDMMSVRKQYGVALARSGAHSAAYFQFTEAVRLGSSEAAVQRELARLSLLMELPDKAAEHFRTSLSTEPLDAIVHLNLVMALGDAGRADEAREAFVAMRRAVPNHKAVSKALEYLQLRGIQ